MSILFWVLLAIGLAVIEIVSTTFFPIFFTISALLALIAFVADASAGIQWAIFGIGGLALSGALRPLAKRQMDKGPSLRSGIEELIGRTGVITTAVENRGVGAVSVDGQIWSARGAHGASAPIEVGADVEILEVRGATLVVAPREKPVAVAPSSTEVL
ncbi:MAG: NfeD family protein [Solirubrobacteraceae bacterium]|nr:NfeD family protein [Solirubrobacteraceae bacterium]